MLKKLRYKFIIITMTIFSIIVTAVISGLYFSAYNDMIERSDEEMQQAKYDAISHTSWFILDNEGNLLSSNFTIEDLHHFPSLKESVSKTKDITGFVYYEDMTFRYLKHTSTVTFMNMTNEMLRISNMLNQSIVIGFTALLFVFISSTLLSLWALEPVEAVWRKQKEFISDASHELRTPVSVILANASILKDSPEDMIESKMKWIQYIEDEARHMSELIERLLFLAKNDQSKLTLHKTNLNFSDLIYEVALPLESIAFEQQKRLDFRISENVFIYGDSSYLKQLVVILLDNAIKYSEDNGTIYLSLTTNGLFCVKNNGKLIPPEQLKRLFERFYRVDDSRQRESEGYGLGLAIASTIAKLHHTKITVTSKKEIGTIFNIKLPLADKLYEKI